MAAETVTVLRVEHPVADFEAWKRDGFDRDPVGRERGGVHRYRVLRFEGGESIVAAVELEFESRAEAAAFAAAEAAAIARWSRGRHGVDDQVEQPQLARRLCQRGLEPRWVSGIGANRERACLLEWLEVRLRSGDTGDAPTTRKQAARDGTA